MCLKSSEHLLVTARFLSHLCGAMIQSLQWVPEVNTAMQRPVLINSGVYMPFCSLQNILQCGIYKNKEDWFIDSHFDDGKPEV